VPRADDEIVKGRSGCLIPATGTSVTVILAFATLALLAGIVLWRVPHRHGLTLLLVMVFTTGFVAVDMANAADPCAPAAPVTPAPTSGTIAATTTTAPVGFAVTVVAESSSALLTCTPAAATCPYGVRHGETAVYRAETITFALWYRDVGQWTKSSNIVVADHPDLTTCVESGIEQGSMVGSEYYLLMTCTLTADDTITIVHIDRPPVCSGEVTTDCI
jgi:hypothetical protein